jgi:lysozyme family protein
MPVKSAQLLAEYQHLFDTCLIKPAKYAAVDAVIKRMSQGRDRYETVSKLTGVPWFFTAIIHTLEGGGKFTTHLHNGDPLSARTVQVPSGRPKTGKPPFKWEDSACDALQLRKLDKVTDWSVPEILFQLEGYNGFGYRVKGINSPYLWSYSNHYSKGKYTSDGHYDPNAVSKQIGAAVILRRSAEQQLAVVGHLDRISKIRSMGGTVVFNLKKYSLQAKELQTALNAIGQPLRVDGFAGRNTSDAYFRVTGSYLKGDNKTA